MHDITNKRQEPRFGIASAILPFLGNRANDYQPFQYLVQDISASGLRIAIPSWVVLREIIYPGDRIQLHVPFEFHGQAHDSGIVAWQTWDADLDAQVCGIALDVNTPTAYPVGISLATKEIDVDLQDFERMEDLLVQVLGDSVLIKRGLSIYLRHLDSYFYRTSLISRQEYHAFRELVFREIFDQVQINAQGLMAAYGQAKEAADIEEAFARILNLEELRQFMQPEIYIELFSRVLSLEVVDVYLKAIKALEQKLYLNYNTIVMLYLKNLIQGVDTQAPAEMPCLT